MILLAFVYVTQIPADMLMFTHIKFLQFSFKIIPIVILKYILSFIASGFDAIRYITNILVYISNLDEY